MIWKEFGIPILLGLVTFGAVVLLEPDLTPDPVLQEGEAAPCVNACYSWLFDHPLGDAPMLVIRDDAAPFVQEPVCAEDCPIITWHTPHVGLARPSLAPCECPPALLAHVGDADRIDVENATVSLTFYAFNDQGELLSTNAPTATLERFRLYGDFAHWNARPWYFGTGNSTVQQLPIGQDIARAAMSEAHVGGVVTLHLESHEYDWLVGPVWITARIDAV